MSRLVKVSLVLFVALFSLTIAGCKSKHNYYVKEEVPATCLDDGYKIEACDCGCGFEEFTNIPSYGGHTFNSEVSCTNTAVCTRCGYEEEAYGHSESDYDCLEGSHCYNCGETIRNGEGHKFEKYVYNKDADYANGYYGTESAFCRDCGIEDLREITTHECTLETYSVKRYATCELNRIEYQQCTECYKIYEVEVENSARGHEVIIVEAKAPGCDYVGWETYEYCGYDCYNYYVEIPAVGHDFSNGDCSVCGCRESSQGLEFKIEPGWYLEDEYIPGYAVLTGLGTCEDTNIVIPNLYQGYQVKEIDLETIEMIYIESIYIPDSIEKVRNYGWSGLNVEKIYLDCIDTWFKLEYYISGDLFVNNDLVTEITVPDDVTILYEEIFHMNYNITSVNLNNVEVIESHAFAGCENLSYVYFGNNLQTIGDYVFHGTNLTSVIIPDSVTEIGYSTFAYCYNLEEVVLSSEINKIPAMLFYECSNLVSVNIPNKVKSIDSEAFYNCIMVEGISLPDSVTSIGFRAFYNCEKIDQFLLTNVKVIESCAFEGCSALSSITIYPLSELGSSVFKNCTSLTNVVLYHDLTEIPAGMFKGCTSLKEVQFSENSVITKIGSNAFQNSGITSLEKLLKNVTVIEDYAFSGCIGLRSVVIPDNVTSLGQYAFSDCLAIYEVYLGKGITEIKNSAFRQCIGLQVVEVSENLEEIEEYAFYKCSSLSSVKLPINGTWKIYRNGRYETVSIPDFETTAIKLSTELYQYKWMKK